ncbi:tetratricopeptide repeat protein [Blautia sp.]|jgi:tetratricopeptide (TPR) repeat protein|uniref:tetratricopeptide repeat protein n=1 Tax=Blautia sp. TaxID=1955243 RepID=UPI0025B9109D|nr:tetratricopeptide repeat protein [Blautia sp.]
MRNKKIICLLAAGLGALLLTGCGGENQKTYEQANADLEQGNYDYALNEYQTCISAGYKLSQSYRGSGIVKLRTGDYQGAIDDLTSALNDEKTGKSDQKDILEYRAAAELKAELYDQAMADCQTLAEDYSLNANDYYLTGCVALAMDSYDEASSNFSEAYGSDSTYEMAIQIYEAYLGQDMEADGTRYLEAALKTEAKTADDYCERGKVYYYMDDYENARTELTTAADKGSTEATLILGMVYMAQGDTSNARSFYQQYIDADGDDPAKGYNGLALCDISDGDYDSALQNISQGLGDATSDEMRDLLFNEIVVYEKKLDLSTALSKAQEYVQTFKDDDAAAKELTFLQSRVGNQAAAGDASEADTSNESTAEESADTGTDESSEESY